MGLTYYKPQKNGKGAACSWNLNSKEGSIFVQIVKQNGEFGSDSVFKTGEKATIQLNAIEAGQIIHVIEKVVDFSTVHKSKEYSTTIGFKPYIVQDENKNNIHKGYGLSFYRDKNGEKTSFVIGFNFGEAETLKQWLIFALNHIFSAIYAVDKKKGEEYAKKKQETPVKEEKVETTSPAEDALEI